MYFAVILSFRNLHVGTRVKNLFTLFESPQSNASALQLHLEPAQFYREQLPLHYRVEVHRLKNNDGETVIKKISKYLLCRVEVEPLEIAPVPTTTRF